MRIKVQVQRKHINDGEPELHQCPIALCLKEQGFDMVYVNHGYIIAYKGNVRYKGKPTRRATRFMRQFDKLANANKSTKKLKASTFIFTLAE